MLFMPESPRWLIMNNQVPQARQVLLKTLTNDDQNGLDVDREIEMVQESIAIEQKTMNNSWRNILLPCNASPELQNALLIGCGVAFFQQCTGIDAVVYYTPTTFTDLGLSSEQIFLCTLFVGITKLLFIFVAMATVDKYGRRKLLMLSSVLLTLSLFGITITFVVGREPVVSVMLQCCYVGAFSLGWGPICWVIISEIYPLEVRSKGMALSVSINRATAGIVALFFVSIQEAITPIDGFQKPQDRHWKRSPIACLWTDKSCSSMMKVVMKKMLCYLKHLKF
eukprot:1015729_1